MQGDQSDNVSDLIYCYGFARIERERDFSLFVDLVSDEDSEFEYETYTEACSYRPDPRDFIVLDKSYFTRVVYDKKNKMIINLEIPSIKKTFKKVR